MTSPTFLDNSAGFSIHIEAIIGIAAVYHYEGAKIVIRG